MSIWSSSYQQIVFKRDHSEKHLSKFYLQDGGKNQLEGKYSLVSTDPRESEIRAHLRPWFSVEWSELRMYYLFIMHQVICWFVYIANWFVYIGKKSPVYGVFGQ